MAMVKLLEGFHNLYSSPDCGDVIKEDEMGGSCSRHKGEIHTKL
jgi:hypothetical protein